jgi:hypothetical protein
MVVGQFEIDCRPYFTAVEDAFTGNVDYAMLVIRSCLSP